MPDPIGSEFGLVADEITYGADLETAMRNLYSRVGQDDLPLFVTAVAIQGSTGGNLGEILQNLSGVIRQRFKMRRKVKALASEGRASAMILSSLPILMFIVVQIAAPDFYGSVWHFDMTKTVLGMGIGWTICDCDNGLIAGALLGGGGTAAWEALKHDRPARNAVNRVSH